MNVNKPKLIICTVGTSIATNQGINIESIENQPLTNEQKLNYEIKSISQGIKSGLSKLDLKRKEYLNKSSAEIKSLVKIGIEKTDQIYLLYTETVDGKLCADLVADYLKHKYGCSVFPKKILGLQVTDGKKFEKEGIHNLLGTLLDLVEPNIYSYDIILNPTGGFKAIVPYIAIIGMFFGLSVRYIFEKSEHLLNFPLIPLEFNLSRFDLIYDKLSMLENNIMNENEFWDDIKINFEERKIFSGIIEEVDGLIDFSPVGRFLFQRFKKQKGVKVYLSDKVSKIYQGLQGKQKESIENYLKKMRDPIFRQQHLHSKFGSNIDAKCYKEPHTAERIFYYEKEEGTLNVAEIFLNHDEYERFINCGKMKKEDYSFDFIL